ncbi:MAG: 2'-5' RNA ligase [Candidatus Peregrinibacteria bacterium Gr01-1014_25]|nr:MAG: 2'-5' RNA ligase [Candidatus Peregrinibacteria bacterium Gr01-1014_25]
MTIVFPLRRAFVALPLDEEARVAFEDLQQSLAAYADILGFQNPQTPHLTLRFWDTLMEIEYRQIVAASASIAQRTTPFTVAVTGPELFSVRGEDRVLFLGVQFSPELAALKKLCPWQNPPGKPFHPHITVARIRHAGRFQRVRKDVVKRLDGAEFSIRFTCLRVYAEIDGHRQTALETFPFSARS